ncbi:MAG: nucleotidyltransferase domain-containing protein [Planctomycetes bacterium]|nr:nucleotidyltransferase domain-containing protein [Planctomycetota bacterium]MCB9904378.1 nucleotidyltransferase domain-containing protein [Planctomycetota bacterium]
MDARAGATIARSELIRHLHERFEGEPHVLAAWLGGSDASGRVDEFSDVDLQLIAEDAAVERCFDDLHRFAEELAPIEVRFRLPEPTWHGFSQEFLRLERCDPNHVIDFLVIPASTPPERRFLEPERHGTARVLFDRGDWLAAPALDRDAQSRQIRRRLEVLRATFGLHAPLVTRSAARGLDVEAQAFYQRFGLGTLVELLRMRHAPERFDFGLRYLDRDLPADDYALVRELAFPQDGPDCARMLERVRARVRAELEALDRGDWSV